MAGRTVLVTGGARRVGAAISRHLARRGARVIVHHRSRPNEASELAVALGAGAFPVRADLATGDGAAALVSACVERGALPDALVHAASAPFVRQPPLGTAVAAWDEAFAVSVRAFYLLACELEKAWAGARVQGREREGEGEATGDLIAIADAAALELWTGYLAHSVAKAALLSLVGALAKALAPRWKVNAVVPGVVLPEDGADEEQVEAMRRRTLLKRIGDPDQVASAVELLLTSPFATGSTIELTGGSHLWRGR